MSSTPALIQVRGPETMIAVVPYLLGFQPGNCLVVIGVTAPHGLVRLLFRYDLPDPPDSARTASIADHATTLLHTGKAAVAAIIGYGSGPLVSPVTDVMRHVLPRAGIRLLDVLRVEDGRYWSYLCTEPSCCPPDGCPLDPADLAAAILAGRGLTVLSSRQALASTIAPLTGAAADAIDQATVQAARLITADFDALGEDAVFDKLRRGVQAAITIYRQGGTITGPSRLAMLALALNSLEVRDDAWVRMWPEHREAHLRLWTDVTRHAMPGYVAGPASLLAFVAWQNGDGALANLAIDRALADDPEYTMAVLIRDALLAGLPPSVAVVPMTPEEVADSYRNLPEDQ